MPIDLNTKRELNKIERIIAFLLQENADMRAKVTLLEEEIDERRITPNPAESYDFGTYDEASVGNAVDFGTYETPADIDVTFGTYRDEIDPTEDA